MSAPNVKKKSRHLRDLRMSISRHLQCRSCLRVQSIEDLDPLPIQTESESKENINKQLKKHLLKIPLLIRRKIINKKLSFKDALMTEGLLGEHPLRSQHPVLTIGLGFSRRDLKVSADNQLIYVSYQLTKWDHMLHGMNMPHIDHFSEYDEPIVDGYPASVWFEMFEPTLDILTSLERLKHRKTNLSRKRTHMSVMDTRGTHGDVDVDPWGHVFGPNLINIRRVHLYPTEEIQSFRRPPVRERIVDEFYIVLKHLYRSSYKIRSRRTKRPSLRKKRPLAPPSPAESSQSSSSDLLFENSFTSLISIDFPRGAFQDDVQEDNDEVIEQNITETTDKEDEGKGLSFEGYFDESFQGSDAQSSGSEGGNMRQEIYVEWDVHEEISETSFSEDEEFVTPPTVSTECVAGFSNTIDIEASTLPDIQVDGGLSIEYHQDTEGTQCLEDDTPSDDELDNFIEGVLSTSKSIAENFNENGLHIGHTGYGNIFKHTQTRIFCTSSFDAVLNKNQSADDKPEISKDAPYLPHTFVYLPSEGDFYGRKMDFSKDTHMFRDIDKKSKIFVNDLLDNNMKLTDEKCEDAMCFIDKEPLNRRLFLRYFTKQLCLKDRKDIEGKEISTEKIQAEEGDPLDLFFAVTSDEIPEIIPNNAFHISKKLPLPQKYPNKKKSRTMKKKERNQPKQGRHDKIEDETADESKKILNGEYSEEAVTYRSTATSCLCDDSDQNDFADNIRAKEHHLTSYQDEVQDDKDHKIPEVNKSVKHENQHGCNESDFSDLYSTAHGISKADHDHFQDRNTPSDARNESVQYNSLVSSEKPKRISPRNQQTHFPVQKLDTHVKG